MNTSNTLLYILDKENEVSELKTLLEKNSWSPHYRMLLLNSLKQTNHDIYNKLLSSFVFFVPNRAVLWEFLNKNQQQTFINVETEKNEKESKLSKNIEKIDKFIKEEPKIKIDTSKESISDLSEESTKDNNEIVTETLAKIYISQNKKHKAIEIYKKMIVKYPEKITYFANQIKLLEKED